tara:strand:+ start:1681 stop:2106 length:426 start_codon:yes stop_codon:yes gene_type:complete
MFDKKYEDRLILWRQFRDGLNLSKDPIQDTIDFYNQAPPAALAADPYTKNTWPNPWELLEENNYCSFVTILAICYTLQLTDVLSQASYEIHITRDNKNSETYYLLYVDDIVIGFNGDTHVHRSKLPATLRSELVHVMHPQQ